MKAVHSNSITSIVSALLILVFAYTGLSKLADMERFTITLRHSPLVASISQFVAYGLPIAELLLSLLLLIPRFRPLALLLSSITMAAFTAYVGWILTTAEKLPCSCGGIISSLSWKNHLLLNVILFAFAAWGYYLSRPRQ